MRYKKNLGQYEMTKPGQYEIWKIGPKWDDKTDQYEMTKPGPI